MEKRWKYKPLPDTEAVASLSASINVSAPIASLLVQRGIKSFEEAKKFFRPSVSDLHNPFLMKDMDKAVERMKKAFVNLEKILVFGDYDVDGTTAVALFYGFLHEKYPHMEFYIPDRYKEGYGISEQGIVYASENGFSLIVSLDCGIKSVEKIAFAKSLGVDFIVCDHHTPGDELPDASAILDPKRKDCEYPFKELSGCGVGFKLLEALCTEMNWDHSRLYQNFDLLAISISSDIVPVVGENRVMTFLGIELLNKCSKPGLKALIDVTGYKKRLDVSSIVFGLGPRINAAGRIAHANAAVQMMLAESKDEADQFANSINEKNALRKEFDASITDEAIAMIEKDDFLRSSKSTVLFKEDWHKGVIGIVASRCIEKYYRPTIILTQSNGKATGSARSVEGFDLYEAISKCSDLLVQYGGHMHAAGLTLEINNIEAFRKKFEEVVETVIKPEQLSPSIDVDLVLEPELINWNFYKVLTQMGPFGPHNMQPVFVTEGLKDDGSAKILKERHLKLKIKKGKSQTYDAIGFDMAHHYPRIIAGEKFDLCYQITENEYNGNVTLQFLIKDIRFNTIKN